MHALGTLLDGADNQAQAAILLRKANQIRLSAMTMTHHSSLGHTGGDLSSADILATLFLGKVLNLGHRQSDMAPAGPLHYVERALFRSFLFHSRCARLFPPRSTLDIYGPSLATEWSSGS